MVSPNEIKPGMPVVCSMGKQFAVVDHMEGNDWVKLRKDERGAHHFIPISWVLSVDDHEVHIDRPAKQAMQQWSTTPSFGGLKSAQPQPHH
jgi:hypothetical protein